MTRDIFMQDGKIIFFRYSLSNLIDFTYVQTKRRLTQTRCKREIAIISPSVNNQYPRRFFLSVTSYHAGQIIIPRRIPRRLSQREIIVHLGGPFSRSPKYKAVTDPIIIYTTYKPCRNHCFSRVGIFFYVGDRQGVAKLVKKKARSKERRP